MTTQAPGHLRVDVELVLTVQAFLYREAELLDRRQFGEWLGLLHPELRYEIPVRLTVGSEHLDSEFSTDSVHLRDSFASIEMRVRRLETEHAFAENPPSRTTRLITNVQAMRIDDADVDARSKFMLYRAQGGSTVHELVTGERRDVLRLTDGRLSLLKRTVYLGHTTLPTMNLGVFL
jgi:3-phenylpropionate/cinnamic acid dioxygenase small subunit